MTDSGMPGVVTHADMADALERYVEAITAGEARAAATIALDLMGRGVLGERVVSDLLAASMERVGTDWARGEVGIAVEHRASAITESVLLTVSQTAQRELDAPPAVQPHRAVVVCCEGEWHTIPGRMASEVLRMRGAEVTFIGPSVPAEDLASFLAKDPPRAVAVTCSMPMNLDGAWRTISALRALGTVIVCGGRGFGQDGRWGWALGVDLWAPDFSRGADLLLSGLAQPERPPREPIGDATIAAELRLLRREHDALVGAALESIVRRYPSVAHNDDSLRATREDLSASLHVVASATVVSDSTVAIEYVRWLEDLLRARSLPVAYVARGFDALLDVLPPEVLRARTMALTGRAACNRARLDPRPEEP